jgi:lipoate-protein ligase A
MPVVRALEKLGVKAEFNSRNDLAIDGRKFSGSAQHMDKRRLLHHGTLLFDSDLSVLGQALAVDEEKFTSKGFRSVRSRVTNILPHLPVKLSMAEFIAALRDSLSGTERDTSPLTRPGPSERSEIRSTPPGSGTGASLPSTPKGRSAAFLGEGGGPAEREERIIADARFFGDFFGVESRDELEGLLAGSPFRKEDLRDRLSTVQLTVFSGERTWRNFWPF